MQLLKHYLREASSVLRRIIGAPDYARYLQHTLEHHPETVPMARNEFLRDRLHAKYSRPGARCC